MAQPAYTLNVGRFEELLTAHGFSTKTAFITASGIPRRTFQSVLAGDREFSARTVAYFLDTFAGVRFDHLFERTDTRAMIAA